ncbi:MAG TPA: amidohydrolase family protein [Thermoanaerobaculia bacterium]|jgi:imidazolonepropionase-like amidohydrolase|nr:amidohydrolase family protein [Thermoanaerobaculia bacterium]
MKRLVAVLFLTALPEFAVAQSIDALSPQVRKYVKVGSSKIILAHVRIIDGTGAAAVADQNISIEGGKIISIGPGADPPQTEGTTIVDLRAYSVMPGIVGMHEHLYYIAYPNIAPDYSYDAPGVSLPMTFSAPRLYLANGVTTARTAGSISPYTDLALKRAIEMGETPGPHLDVTGPYLEGASKNSFYHLTGAEDARETVAYWANRGVTSFKAYQNIARDEMRAAIDEAHKHRLKVTGHLCSVTYAEAAEMGIDNLEHGFFVNTELDPDKKTDTCSASRGDYTLERTIPGGAYANHLIATLVQHHVALTSTLTGTSATAQRLDAAAEGRPALRPAVFAAMSANARETYLYWRNRPRPAVDNTAFLLRREMDLERAFVAAGGLLLAGPDPVGIGGNIPGFGDQRQIELLVDAGFTPLEAIRIATLNGAVFLGRENEIGSIAVGKHADLVVIKGDPSTRIADIENVEIVFKDGVGYDTRKLLDSVKGHYGDY